MYVYNNLTYNRIYITLVTKLSNFGRFGQSLDVVNITITKIEQTLSVNNTRHPKVAKYCIDGLVEIPGLLPPQYAI